MDHKCIWMPNGTHLELTSMNNFYFKLYSRIPVQHISFTLCTSFTVSFTYTMFPTNYCQIHCLLTMYQLWYVSLARTHFRSDISSQKEHPVIPLQNVMRFRQFQLHLHVVEFS